MRQPPRPINGAHCNVTGTSYGILLANINSQKMTAGDAEDHTIRDVDGTGIVYPAMVALFKRGAIDDSVMVHTEESESEGSNNEGSFSIPSGLQVKTVSRTRITLSWNDVDGESGYIVRWKKAKHGRWKTIKVGANTTYLSHTGLKRRTTYQYQIRANRLSSKGGKSVWSSGIFATTR